MNGKRRQRKQAKTFGNIASAVAATTTHMQTARGMKERGEGAEAVKYLTQCGWHHETAHGYLYPDPRNRSLLA